MEKESESKSNDECLQSQATGTTSNTMIRPDPPVYDISFATPVQTQRKRLSSGSSQGDHSQSSLSSLGSVTSQQQPIVHMPRLGQRDTDRLQLSPISIDQGLSGDIADLADTTQRGPVSSMSMWYRDQDLAEIEDEWNDSAHDGPSIGLTIVKPNKSLHKCLCERNYIPFADERQNIMDKK